LTNLSGRVYTLDMMKQTKATETATATIQEHIEALTSEVKAESAKLTGQALGEYLGKKYDDLRMLREAVQILQARMERI